jgi:hypothetical protein
MTCATALPTLQNAAVFQFHLSFAVEQCNAFYVEKEVLAKEAFDNVARAVQAVAQVLPLRLPRPIARSSRPLCFSTLLSDPDWSRTWSLTMSARRRCISIVKQR